MSSSGAVLAAKLDDARRQLRLNDTLRRAVLDADDASRRAHATIAVAKTRGDVTRHSHRAIEQLSEFEKMSSFAVTRRFNPALLLQETDQRVGLEKLVKPGDQGSTESLENVADIIRRLLKSGSGHNTPFLTAFCERALQGLDKAVTLLRDTTLDSATWCRIPESLLVLLEEFATVASPEAVVLDGVERIARMEFECDELEHQQEEALTEGDMKRMEELYFQRVAVQEAMVGVFDAVFHQLDEHVAEAHSGPLERVRGVHESASGDVSTIMHRTETLKKQVGEDLSRLNKARDDATAAAHARKQRASTLREESDAFLRQNLVQIEQCYAAIDDLCSQIRTLSAARTEALEARLRFVEEEDCYAADVNHFHAFYKQHSALLEDTQHTLDVSDEVTDLIDEIVCGGCNAIEQQARANLAAIDKVRMDLHERRLKQFRQLYLTLGDLRSKKERNMEELEKKIEHTHIQQELAMETFNPKAKEYSEAKKALLAIREEMASQVQVLANKSVLHIEAFKPTEEALVRSGKTFLHPAVELEELNRKREQKLLEYQTLMSTESGGSPDGVDGGLPPVDERDLQEEMRRIELEQKQQEKRRLRHSTTKSTASSIEL